tara:strand:+ start:182 stop:517 length:336 start_codon:yes stop_codon:yes gene_type:complete
MKLTKSKLKQIIKEEIQKMSSALSEGYEDEFLKPFDQAVENARMVYDRAVDANPEMTEQGRADLYGKLLDKAIHEAGLTPRKMSASLSDEAAYIAGHEADEERLARSGQME